MLKKVHREAPKQVNIAIVQLFLCKNVHISKVLNYMENKYKIKARQNKKTPFSLKFS